MAEEELIEKIKALPPDLQMQVADFVDYVVERKVLMISGKKQRTSGQLKGKVWMSADFDEPLEDLKEYM